MKGSKMSKQIIILGVLFIVSSITFFTDGSTDNGTGDTTKNLRNINFPAAQLPR
jgi:hypothetical protein